MWDDIEKSGKAYLVKRGNKIVTLSKEEETRWVAAQTNFAEYTKSMKEKGLPGEEALEVCHGLSEAIQKVKPNTFYSR